HDRAPTEIYTLSLHDALPISDTGVFNNLKGEFFIPAAAGDVLLVAAEGYFADTVKVLNESTLILYLHRSSIWIKDVHVFGQKSRSEEHTSELQSRENLVCRLL